MFDLTTALTITGLAFLVTSLGMLQESRETFSCPHCGHETPTGGIVDCHVPYRCGKCEQPFVLSIKNGEIECMPPRNRRGGQS